MLSKIIDFIGFDKILDYLIEIIDFYIRPIKFSKNFSKRKLKDKITQTILYIIIIGGLAYSIVGDITIKEIIKKSFYGLISLGIPILILIISELIISKIAKNKPRYTDMIFFPILVKLFYGTIASLIFEEYIQTENYDWLFWHNIFLVFIVFYAYYFSAYIFHNKIKFILLNVVLNFILLHSFHFILCQIKIDKYSSIKPSYYNVIAEERFEKGKIISDFFIVPIYKIIDIKKDESISFYVFTSYGNKAYDRKLNVKKYIRILDTMSFKFRRNKEFFRKYKNLYMKIDSLITRTDSIPLEKYDYPNLYKRIKVIDTINKLKFERVIIGLINDDIKDQNPVNHDLENEELVKKIIELRKDLGTELIKFNNMGDRSIIPLIALKYIYNIGIKINNNKYPNIDENTRNN